MCTVGSICIIFDFTNKTFLLTKVPSLNKMSEWKGVHHMLRCEIWAMRTDRLKLIITEMRMIRWVDNKLYP